MNKESWDRIRDSYDVVASSYEAKFLDELADKPYDRELLDRLAAESGDPVLEVGCGPGQIGAHVRSRGRRVIGTDFSPEMVHLAAHRLDSTAVADLRHLPARDQSIGAVVGFYCLIHLRRGELAGALSEFRRVLRPGGRLLISAHEGPGELATEEFLGQSVPFVATLFNLDELTEAARSAGLEITRAERRSPYASEGQTMRLYVEAVRP